MRAPAIMAHTVREELPLNLGGAQATAMSSDTNDCICGRLLPCNPFKSVDSANRRGVATAPPAAMPRGHKKPPTLVYKPHAGGEVQTAFGQQHFYIAGPAHPGLVSLL